jgi:hypothetical protein
MKRHNWISHAAVIVFLAAYTVQAPGQKMNVKIIQRQNNESEYTYVVPGHFNSTSNTNLNCNTGASNVNCTGRTTTSGTSTEPREISYRVAGATFSLLLPDGRVTVVNCEGKPLSVWGNGGPGRAVSTGERPWRSCRMPLVDDIQVEFKGKNAKLIWLASVDGKKFDSERYKILAVLERQAGGPAF